MPNLVYSARGNEVDTVIIDGNVVMEGRELKTVEEKEYVLQAHKAAEKLAERAEGKLDKDSKLLKMMEKDML